ncbi:hypothetical protein D1007_56315 [Hordeum vulgare]|nr:hypothetical protein D1007_56315 [Hordeum vulgare]
MGTLMQRGSHGGSFTTQCMMMTTDAAVQCRQPVMLPTAGMERTCVYVHHVDKDAFLKGNIDPDPDELDMVFDCCPSYAELLKQVPKDLNWMDPSDVVEFDGRHNVGFGMHIRWKTMRVNSEQRWLAYKDMVAESLYKALELFAIKINDPNLHLDLNRVASPIVEASPLRINEEANNEPLLTQQSRTHNSKIQHEPLLEENDEHDEHDDENDNTILHDNNLGMAASQPNKATTEWGEDKDAVGEDQGLWERAAKKLREEDTSKVERKKEQEREANMKEELKITLDHYYYEKRIKGEHKNLKEKRQRDLVSSYKKATAESAAKREREHQCFTERVMKEDSKMRKREEEAEEERKKK